VSGYLPGTTFSLWCNYSIFRNKFDWYNFFKWVDEARIESRM